MGISSCDFAIHYFLCLPAFLLQRDVYCKILFGTGAPYSDIFHFCYECVAIVIVLFQSLLLALLVVDAAWNLVLSSFCRAPCLFMYIPLDTVNKFIYSCVV